MQDLSTKVNNGGTTNDGKLFASDWNQAAAELLNIINGAGLTPSAINLFQCVISVAQFSRGYGFWCTTSGTGAAYTATGVATTAPTLFSGMTIKFRPHTNSTVTNPTVNYGGTGAKTIVNEAGAALVIGDLDTSRDAELRYDGTNWRLLNRCLNTVAFDLYAPGYITGFFLANDGSLPDDAVVVGPGNCASSDATFNLILATNFIKRIDQTWAVGSSSVGGRPAAVSLANDTWYRVFVIGGTGALTDAGFDTLANASNLLSAASTATGNTYNKYRQVGWVLTDGSSNIVRFYADPTDARKIHWQTPVNVASGSNPATTRLTGTATAPADSKAILSAWIGAQLGATREYVLDIRASAMTDIAASATNFVLRLDEIGSGNASDSTVIEVPINASAQFAYRFAELTAQSMTYLNYQITTRGFVYSR